MNFALSAEHELLRDTARAFLDKEVDLGRILRAGATLGDAGDASLWSKMVGLGWSAMIIPERLGGLGMTELDFAMIAGECGRSLASSPLLGTTAGVWALLRAGSGEQTSRILPRVAQGDIRLALAATDAHGRFDSRSVRAQGDKLTGQMNFVLDAMSANRIVVSAQDASGKDALFLVEAPSPGFEAQAVPWRDITRQVAAVRLHDTPGERLGGDAWECWRWVRDRLYLSLAAESAAGLHKVLADTVAYAKQRVAFGRAIGGYQAIKHSLAEIKGWAECASAAVLYAAWALAEDDPRAPLAACMAQAYASEAYRDAAFRSIQIFGAIGFTWEMPCHLYYKRARANAELLGSPAQQRAEVVAMLESAHRNASQHEDDNAPEG